MAAPRRPEAREDLLETLPFSNAPFDAVHVPFVDHGVLGDVGFESKEPSQHGASFRTSALTRPQQLLCLVELLVDQNIDVGGRAGRDLQHALGQMVSESLVEDGEEISSKSVTQTRA